MGRPTSSSFLATALFALALVAVAVSVPAALRAGTPGDESLREQTVYVPYERLEDVFEKEGRGVFVPYARFLELWRKGSAGEDDPTPPPVPVVISRARWQGRVSGDVVFLEGRLDVEALAAGWALLPLPLEDVAVADLKVDGDSVVAGMHEGAPHIIARKPGRATLTLTLAVPLASATGERSFEFQPPPVAAATLELTVPEAGAKVRVEPALPLVSRTVGGDTVVSVGLGGADTVRLAWTSRPRESRSAEPLVFATGATVVRVGAGAVVSEATLDYRILQAGLRELRVKMPRYGDVTAVDGEGVTDWQVEGKKRDRVLVLKLSAEARGDYRLRLTVERPFEPGATPPFWAPEFHALDALRQQGYLAVHASAGLRVAVESAMDCHQIDPDDLPPELRAQRPALAIRYLRQPFRLNVSALPIAPRVQVRSSTTYVVDDERVTLDTTLALGVERAGIFQFRVVVPDGWDVRDVHPAGRTSVIADYHVADGEDGRRVLTVRLASKQLGDLIVPVSFERARAADELELTLPTVEVLDTYRQTGALGVAVRDRYRARTEKAEGLRPVDIRSLRRFGLGPTGNARTPLVMGYRFERPGGSVTLRLEPRAAQLVAATETLVSVHEDVAKVQATVRWEIRHAAVDRLAFTLPSSLDDRVRVEGAAVKERAPSPGPTAGVTRWDVILQRETEGEVPVVVTYEHPLSGDGGELAVAEIVPLGVDRDSGHFAVVRAGNLEIAVARSEGLEAIDAKELPEALRVPGVFQAFRYIAHPHALTLNITKHAYEPVLQAIADVTLLETVVSEELVARTEMALVLQSNQRQYLELRLPTGAEVLTAFVDGEMVRPARRDDGTILLKMPRDSAGGDRRFVTRVVYQSSLGEGDMGAFGSLELTAPELVGVPTSLLLWRVWTPKDYRYFAPGGTLHPLEQLTGGWERNKQRLQAILPEDLANPAQSANYALEQVQDFMDNDAKLREFEGAESAGAMPIRVRLVRQGVAHEFSKLSGGGTISLPYVSTGAHGVLDLALLALAFVGLLLLGRLAVLRDRRVALAAAALAVPLALSWFVSPPAAALLTSCAIGAALAAALWLAGWAWRGRAAVGRGGQRVVEVTRGALAWPAAWWRRRRARSTEDSSDETAATGTTTSATTASETGGTDTVTSADDSSTSADVDDDTASEDDNA